MSVKQKISTHWLARTSLDLLFPVECVGCGAEGQWTCDKCQPLLVRSRPDICVLCAKAGDNGLCEKCQRHTGLDGVVSLFTYTNPLVRELIKAGKFGGYHSAIRFLANYFADAQFAPDTIIAPVPLSRQRLAERGYNQAAVIARVIAPQPARFFTGLVRTKETAPQSLLKKKDRIENMKSSFTCSQPAPERVILVDDVITTGATLSAATKALQKAGAKKVWAMTITHG